MTKDDYEKLSVFERELLEEMRKIRSAIENATRALEKAAEF